MVSDTSTPSLQTCKRVLQCESMRIAGEARTRAACVMSVLCTRVLCTRVLVCKAQRSERGRGSGEAKPGARHAFCALGQSVTRLQPSYVCQ